MADILVSGMLPFWVFRCTSNAESCVRRNKRFPICLRDGNGASVTEAGKEFIG
jgi:hypothetical protein